MRLLEKDDLESLLTVQHLLLLIILLVVLIASGCGGPDLRHYAKQGQITDPTDPSGTEAALQGVWARDPEQHGYMFVDIFPGDSLSNCVAFLSTWTLWAGYPQSDRRSQFLDFLFIYNLHVTKSADSDTGVVTSKLEKVWLYSVNEPHMIPIPDTLGAILTRVVGTYAERDSFLIGEAPDSNGIYYKVYEYRPGLRLTAYVSGPKLSDSNVFEQLMRIRDLHPDETPSSTIRPEAIERWLDRSYQPDWELRSN